MVLRKTYQEKGFDFYNRIVNIMAAMWPSRLNFAERETLAWFLFLGGSLPEKDIFGPNTRKLVRQKTMTSSQKIQNDINSLAFKNVLKKDENDNFILHPFFAVRGKELEFNLVCKLDETA